MKKIGLVIAGCFLFIQGIFAQGTFNLAKYQSVTADSYASDKPVQFANDGFVSQDSRWVSTGYGPHWLEIEMAVPMTIGSAHLYSGGTWDAAMSDISLQVHNGTSWINIPGATRSGNSSPVLNLMFDSPVTAQKFRLYTTDGTARVIDLALYPPTDDSSMVPFGTDMDLNLAKLRQIEASSISGMNYPKLAVDGFADDTSCWVGSAGTQELEISWLQAEKIQGIHLYSGQGGVAGTQIQNFNVDYWDSDLTSWVPFGNGSVYGNTELEREVLFDAAVATTKIRIQTLDTSAPRIRELVALPENGGTNYPLWTDVRDEAPPTESFLDYDDGYYRIENRDTGLNLHTTTNGSSVVSATDIWFQILLNIGTDTYRLRSKDSGECFEVSQASTHEGAAVVEGVYSSMPHQRWKLVDSGDGTHFRIVNVWSGQALNVVGSTVVQTSISSDASQEWSFDYQTHVPKRGQVAFFHYNSMYKPNWFYSWNATAENACEYGDYHPQQWGWFTGTAPVILRDQPKWYARAQPTCAMGFNEPDKADQSNIPAEDAADQWPRFERMRLPLVGPVVAQNYGDWRPTYEALAEERGHRSEYMGLHWYSHNNSGNPTALINLINNLYNTYGKPIWITEFAVKDWGGDSTNWNRNDNFNWMAEFLWRAEGIAHLKKYTFFEWGNEDNNDDPTVNDAPTMGLHRNQDKADPGWEDLNELGLMLSGWDGVAEVRNETAYIIHNQGRGLRLIDHPASNTVSHANILHRTATDQFKFETAPNGNKYITGLSDGRRLSYNGSSVGLVAADTTGTAVEWELNEYQYGWYYIDHPSTSKRLRITATLDIDVESNTASYDALMFRFIRPAVPIEIAEVQSLPYTESFEDGTGAWRQFDDDDYDWEIGREGTPTAGAGPNGASNGDNYLFAEGHDTTGSYQTSSVSCTFDFSTTATVLIGFDYHMYGNYIDFLSLDVFDGTSWASNVWTKNGQQQSSSEAAWKKAVIDLSAYAGNNEVTLRFRTATGEWNAADPAIDHIRIDADTSNNTPVATAQSVTTDEDIAVTITLSGSDPDGDPLSYQVASPPAHGTLSGSGAHRTYTPDAGFYGEDSFSFTVDDGLAISAEATVSISVIESYVSLPYAESFENGFGDWKHSVDDDFDWTRNSGGTPTGSTGPGGASDGDWYLYAEGHDAGGADKITMIECVLNMSSASNVELSFDYHMYGGYIDYLALDVHDGTTWSSNVWKKTGQQQTSSTDPWLGAVVGLSDYAGNDEVTLRFRSKKKEWHGSDAAIDNIYIGNPDTIEYDQWALDAFSGAPDGTDQTALGNPDGDRFDNELEWALVTDPLMADGPPMDILVNDPDFIVTYTRRDPSITGIDVHAAWAPSVISTVWRLNGDGMTEVSAGWVDDIETMEVQLPMTGANKFIRLEVIR